MFRPQMLEAIFVAGSVLVGIGGGSGAAWSRSVAVARAEAHIGYELVSARGAGVLIDRFYETCGTLLALHK